MAASFGYLDIVNILIDFDLAYFSTPDRAGLTPLHVAALSGHLEVVKALVQGKADVFKRDIFGWTPISLAVQHGHSDVVHFLLKGTWKGERIGTFMKNSYEIRRDMVNIEDLMDRTPLHLASHSRQGPLVELLLQNEGDPYSLDCYGRRAYHWINLDPNLRHSFEVQIRQAAPSDEWCLNRMLRRTINKLTTFLINNGGYPTTPGYRELGHCLIYRSKFEDAITAFEQVMASGETRDDVRHPCMQCLSDNWSATCLYRLRRCRPVR